MPQVEPHLGFAVAFNEAVGNTENRNEDGTVNWDYVDADVYREVGSFYPGAVYTKLFDDCADEYEA